MWTRECWNEIADEVRQAIRCDPHCQVKERRELNEIRWLDIN